MSIFPNNAAAVHSSIDDHTLSNGIGIPLRLLTRAELEQCEAEARDLLSMIHGLDSDFDDVLESLHKARASHIDALYDALVEPYVAYIKMTGCSEAATKVQNAYWKMQVGAKVRCTVHPMQMLVSLAQDTTNQQVDRYSRALRYALYNKTQPENLKEFLGANGGIDGCVLAYRALTTDPNGNRITKPKAKVSWAPGMREALVAIDAPFGEEVLYTIRARREANGRFVVTAVHLQEG